MPTEIPKGLPLHKHHLRHNHRKRLLFDYFLLLHLFFLLLFLFPLGKDLPLIALGQRVWVNGKSLLLVFKTNLSIKSMTRTSYCIANFFLVLEEGFLYFSKEFTTFFELLRRVVSSTYSKSHHSCCSINFIKEYPVSNIW